MRFPSLTQLDRDQKAIYNGAPPDDSILVMGPPGTGKTVMAFYRAALLVRLGQEPTIAMFNKVLHQYASSDQPLTEGVNVRTMRSWASSWWSRVNKRGLWAPTVEGDDAEINWMKMLNGTISALVGGKTTAERANWGHLILDEGQDFSPDAYSCLRMVADHLESTGHPRPAVSVFADENQRLTQGKNSSLREIQQALCLDVGADGRVFSLRKNYRNTRPVAEFASHFFVGLASGKPDLPSSAGRKPTMYFAERVEEKAALEAVRRTISTYAVNNAGKDVGVLCASDRMRKKLFNSMKARLADTGLRVQTYSYKDREEHPAEELEFDTGKGVTLLNFQSAKGLEFDTVFIIDPFEALSMGGSDEQRFKMQMYVMSTRARKELYVFVLTQSPRAELLPPEHLYVRTAL